MDKVQLWKVGAAIAVTGAISLLSIWWKKNKKSSNGNRSQLPDGNWLKVGEVKELYCYPLKSGRGKDVKCCKFTEFGISIVSDDEFTLRDRMFLVYYEENGKFVTGKTYPKLVLVNLFVADKSNIRLEANGMESLDFDPESVKSDIVDCSMHFGEQLKCLDCGDETAEWISTYLTGKKSGLRLGMTAYLKRDLLINETWGKMSKVYKTLSNDDAGLFSDITSYMLTTEASLNELNKKLKRRVTSRQFRPNIVVSGTDPFAEDKWEWIKIGKNVVIRNVKPCPRCVVIRIDPDTGNVDDEPLTCLRNFRAQDDPERISVDGTSPVFGIYCGLYSHGNVTIGDEVFVHA